MSIFSPEDIRIKGRSKKIDIIVDKHYMACVLFPPDDTFCQQIHTRKTALPGNDFLPMETKQTQLNHEP